MPSTGGGFNKVGRGIKGSEPVPKTPREKEAVGLPTDKTDRAEKEDAQMWELPSPPYGGRDKGEAKSKRGERPYRIRGLPEEGSGCRRSCAGRNCCPQPATGDRSLEWQGARVRVEDLDDPDKLEKVWGMLRLHGGTGGEGGEPSKSPAGTVKQERAEEDRNRKDAGPPGKESQRGPGGGGGDDPPQGGDGGGHDHEDKIGLKYAPACCSCNKQGVEKLQHTGEMDTWPTFAKRPIRKGSKTLLGVCLMQAPHGLLQGNQGRLCGHTPCMQCTRKKQEQLMCGCCASRLEVMGAGKGGAGPLPPRPEERRTHSRSRTPPRGTPGHGGSRAPERYHSPSESDSDRRSARLDAGAARGAVPSPRSPPRQDEQDPDMRDRSEDDRLEFHKCAIQGCRRPARGPGATCCDPCAQSGGSNFQFGPAQPRTDRDRGDDDYDQDEDEDRDEHRPKGKGKGKGKPWKSEAKAQRDRDRWRSWDWNKRGIKRSWNPARFAKALTMGRADSTLKCTTSRLCTWDRVMETLEDKEVIPRETLPGILTAKRLTAGVACLKSQGYRSAELYMSAALLRHRARYGQSPEITMASRDATRMARRGRGPPAGKQPVPIPKANAPRFEEIAVGIWYLLRVGELVALNVEDVLKRKNGEKLLVAIRINTSKTDQEEHGELVARECTCGDDVDDMCPAHLLWDQVSERRAVLQKLGSSAGAAPLFVGPEGYRITVKEIQEAINFTATEAGEPLADEGGRARYGTHSMRVAGALAAFCAGVDENTIRAEVGASDDDVPEGDPPCQSLRCNQGDVPGDDTGPPGERCKLPANLRGKDGPGAPRHSAEKGWTRC